MIASSFIRRIQISNEFDCNEQPCSLVATKVWKSPFSLNLYLKVSVKWKAKLTNEDGEWSSIFNPFIALWESRLRIRASGTDGCVVDIRHRQYRHKRYLMRHYNFPSRPLAKPIPLFADAREGWDDNSRHGFLASPCLGGFATWLWIAKRKR